MLVRVTPDGRRLGTRRISNSPARLRTELAKAGAAPQVVLEACYGWYLVVDALEAASTEVHLAHLHKRYDHQAELAKHLITVRHFRNSSPIVAALAPGLTATAPRCQRRTHGDPTATRHLVQSLVHLHGRRCLALSRSQ